MNKVLKITLQSDLCAGSGFAYAGVIDSDISYNKNGIPYISGRRIKGCMREAAELIGVKDSDRLFGKWGSRDMRGIVIGNAYPEQYRDVSGAVDELRRSQDERMSYLTPENILEYFTSVRAQTGMKEGVAEDNSLRFTRVVGQYDRSSGNALVFCAPVFFPDADAATEEKLQKAAKATRHIGLHRNRGLGNVKMELVDCDVEGDINGEADSAAQKDTVGTAGKKKIRYYVTNVEPLLLSSEQDDVTDSYIGGGRVRGALAGEYLKRTGCSDQDEEFTKLFLQEGTIFSNLTLVSEKERQPLYPAPLYLCKLKKTKDIVNIAVKAPEIEDEKKDYGNLPKKMKGVCAAESNGVWLMQEPQTEILYHHRRQGDTKLYFLEALSEGQTFCGEIIVDAGLSALTVDLLKKARLRFGKSRSAQYGGCRLVGEPVVEDSTGMEKKSCRKGTRVLVTLQSDGAFTDGEGNYTVEYRKVRALIAAEFNKMAGKRVLQEDDHLYGILQAGIAAGYNTKWNLQKPQFPVVRAGSAFGFVLGADLEEYPPYIGEHQLDGRGKITVFDLDSAQYFVDSKNRTLENESGREKIANREEEQLPSCLLPIYRHIVLKKLYEKLEYGALSNECSLNIHPSALGRLTLMLGESVNESQGDGQAAVRTFQKLADRVASVKSKSTREEMQRFLGEILGTDSCKDSGEMAFIGQISKKMLEMGGKTGKDCREAFGEEGEQIIFGLWPRYLQSVLNYQKYCMKQGEE
ncbi:MAG TPA: hypothetical protein DF613_17215 [Lachnospiraceae bacterium]|nr:hypothetical protein [Lachnospiraceae bacterium]